ncbi:MAG TPA: DUF922 domain-containing protein [Gammaproteobacteria bacterium]|nr:DUF922 domain-containing protein [Gammaproteobacteria bacterium]
MVRTLRFIPLLLISATLSPAARAEIIKTVEYKYYTIAPRSPYEIKPELMRRSPIRAGSGSFNGHTDWYIDWKYQATPSPYGCQLRDTQTTVRVVHTLPTLSEYVTDKETIDVFNKFNSALTQHEKNHGQHGISAARDIDEALNAIQTQPNCRQLSRMINDIGSATVQKYIQKDVEYDRVTNNGLTEGAVIY